MTIGKKIQNAIKGKGMSMEEAAEKLGMTRQTLYNSILKRGEIDETVLQTVITKLGIQLQYDKEDSENEIEKNNKTDDYQTKYIAILEKNLKDKEENISSLKDEILEIKAAINKFMPAVEAAVNNRASLEQIRKDQETMMDWNLAFREALAGYVTGNPQQARELLQTADKVFVQYRKGLNRKGIARKTGI